MSPRTNRRSSRHRLPSVIGLVLVLSAIPGSNPVARAVGESFSGYETSATGSGFTFYPVVPALLPVDAPAEATVSLAYVSLSTGGLGYGRASTAWPGTPIAGIRPLIEIASGQRLPTPDYPLAVESREYEDAKTDTYPGMTMTSDIDPDVAIVTADGGGHVVPGAFEIGDARTVSTSKVTEALVEATSTATINGISFGGGALKIDSIVSVATASSDATTSTCGGSVTVSGLEIGGVAATLDSKGVHAAGNSSPALPDPNSQIASALAASGMNIRMIGGLDRCEGAAGSRSTGGVLVSFPVPSAGSIPPGGHLDVILGSTFASASANPASTFDPGDTDDGDPPVLGEVVPRVPGPAVGGLPEPAALPDSGVPTTDADDEPATLTPAGSSDDLDYSFDGVPVSLVLGLTALAFPGARRIRRYMDHLFTMSTTA